MRTAAGLSVAIHIGLIAGAWIVMGWQPEIDEMSAESVSVDIISMDAVSENPSDIVTASTQNLASAGAEHEAMEVPEVTEVAPAETPPVEIAQPVAQPVAAASAEVLEPAESEEIVSAEVMTATADTIDPVEAAIPKVIDAAASFVADTVAASESDPLDALHTATLAELTPDAPTQPVPPALLRPAEPVEPIETASLAPVLEEEPQVVPIPQPRLVRKPAEPAKETPKKATTKPAEKPQDKPPSKQASLGNGGASDADSAASSKSGGGAGKTNASGSAAVSKYPGLVQARVARAAKRPKGSAGGEALVSFTVSASGGVTRVGLARSSGNDAVDQAALAAVNRAAPFPPIPADAGRSSWQFTVPIQFKK